MKKAMQNGITLIALVITIIMMLILAGVSINAIVGENGILARATNAKLITEDAARREALEMILFDYNTSEFLGEINGIEKYLQNAKKNDEIQAFSASSDGEYAIIRYEGHNYEATREAGKGNYAISGEVDSSLEVDDNIILTANTINNIIEENGGSFAFENGDSYIVKDDIKAEEFNFNISDNATVTIKLMTDMTIDNVGYQRSAINLGENSILNLYVYGNVTVNSGLGEKGDETDYMSSNAGGYAGIHVPESATLNLYGTGTITAIGGDAGDGNAFIGNTSSSIGGSGGGGAGAGIGGNGGDGTGYAVGKGADGGNGENCGTVKIYNSLTVYAYGGAGGSGADATIENGGGGGGYPAAGIGGGGAGASGGTCCSGGAGYSGGGGDQYLGSTTDTLLGRGGIGGKNGNSGERLIDNKEPLHSGGGYNVEDVSTFNKATYDAGLKTLSNGMGGIYSTRDGQHFAGNGGTAGKGGTVLVSSSANVVAYNGNKYTDDGVGHEYNKGKNQVKIYAQDGIVNIRYSMNYCNNYGKSVDFSIIQEYDAKGISTTNYINQSSKDHQGVGSGAGYIEVSNGTYSIDSSLN